MTIIVALEVPLAFNLQARGVAEVEANLLTFAQAAAASARNFLDPSEESRDRLAQTIRDQAVDAEGQPIGRVIVVDADGILIADSGGSDLGRLYATPERPELITALEEGIPAKRQGRSETLDETILAVAVPILEFNPRGGLEAIGAVRVSVTDDQVQRGIRRSVIGLVAIGVAGLVAGLLIAFVLAGTLSRPLRRLAAAAGRLGKGDLSARAGDVRGAREIEEVGHAFDDMAARLEATVRAQREFTANASHQLRTPLTGLKLRLESAQEEAADGHLREQLQAAEREVDRLAEIVERLLVLARRIEDGRPADKVDLDEAARRATARLKARAARAGAELSVRGPGAQASAAASEVDQILDNLVDNAISYAPGPIAIETGRVDGRAFLAVEDHGPGIPEDERDRVTERFYRGRGAPAGGSGLGLAIVRELAERAGGSLTVGQASDGGARIEVQLPLCEDTDGQS